MKEDIPSLSEDEVTSMFTEMIDYDDKQKEINKKMENWKYERRKRRKG